MSVFLADVALIAATAAVSVRNSPLRNRRKLGKDAVRGSTEIFPNHVYIAVWRSTWLLVAQRGFPKRGHEPARSKQSRLRGAHAATA